MSIFKNNKGFSLIELMIVVAIIGILAAVAIPNFQTFIRRSKQSHAKSNLAVVYSGQRAFYDEWNFYIGQFGHIGYAPEGDMTYEIQTAAVVDPGGGAGLYTQRKGAQVSLKPHANDTDTTTYCTPADTPCTMNPVTAVPPAACGVQGSAAAGGAPGAFTACASAALGGVQNDEWSINEAKALTQMSVGE